MGQLHRCDRQAPPSFRCGAHQAASCRSIGAAESADGTAKALGVKEASDISTHDLLERFRRHQKVRLRATTFDRLGGILKTLEANLPELAKNIGKKSVAAYIETRSETVAPGTIAKEVSTLKHALRLAVEWGELHENAASGARLPKQPEGKTRYLTPGELRAALEIAPEWMRAPITERLGNALRLSVPTIRGTNERSWLDQDCGGSPLTPEATLSSR